MARRPPRVSAIARIEQVVIGALVLTGGVMMIAAGAAIIIGWIWR